jgi:hypothetical protein
MAVPRADATIALTPAIVVSRRAASFSFTERTHSASKVAYPSIEIRPLSASVGLEPDHPRAQSRSALFALEHAQVVSRWVV